ncbi:MAG: PPC domain-containing protein [Sandaracinaceae bacterium]|nr:PPC domain-containing protein [Sandaracinaceae bacterium]
MRFSRVIVLLSFMVGAGCGDGRSSPNVDAGVPEDMSTSSGDMSADDAGGDAGAVSTGAVGDGCTTNEECGENAGCIQGVDSDGNDTGFVGGYCISLPEACGDGACADGTVCYNLNLGATPTPACIRSCADDSECRPGYVCDSDSTCWPGCDSTHACPTGLACNSSGVCVTPFVPDVCSATHPSGFCEGAQLCIDGACMEPPACDTDTHEPNNTRETATMLTVGTPAIGGRCASDVDWYRIEVPAGQIIQVVAAFPSPTVANLDLFAYRADGTPLGARIADIDSMPSWARAYDTNEEAFGFYTGATAGGTYYVKVTGAATSTEGAYALTATSIPWTDGPSCTAAGYSMSECTGGARDHQTLIPNPFPDPADTFVGSDYVHDTMSNYRFLRRETMMLVRNAVHEVQAHYPGTHPLGMIDQCQRNAITPGYDVDDPRHPESTHDQGGNIDIAYFQTGADNHARIICDADKGTEDGAYCLPGATTSHIVDLERQVYFMVVLTRSPRVRVIGVDRVIAPLLEAQARTMQAAGTITMTEMNTMLDSMAFGDGWPYHHHHIHLSLQWL